MEENGYEQKADQVILPVLGTERECVAKGGEESLNERKSFTDCCLSGSIAWGGDGKQIAHQQKQ